MKRHRHTPEQIVRKLREGERMLNEGKDLAAVLRTLEITESTWARWRSQYGGMKADGAKRLKELRVAASPVARRGFPTRRAGRESGVDLEDAEDLTRQAEEYGQFPCRFGATSWTWRASRPTRRGDQVTALFVIPHIVPPRHRNAEHLPRARKRGSEIPSSPEENRFTYGTISGRPGRKHGLRLLEKKE
jgi:hypothetical protein